MGEKMKTMDKVNFCNKCQLERINNRSEGCFVCINCGDCEFCLFQAVNYTDMPSGRICQHFYKRRNHLKVILRRFQAAESENVPEKVYDIIKRDLLKRRIRWDGIEPIPTLTNIMEISKNNKLTKYYNNIQQIYCGVTGVAPPTLTRKEEEKIIEMFQEVERSYRKYINRHIFLATHIY